jgi:hypothetical protein
LRKTPYKWLDLNALCRDLLHPDNSVERIRYFTAPVGGKLDPGQPVRQQIYLRAISADPLVSIHLGTFLTTNKVRPLAHPVPGGPTHAEIINSEEKGSDVNLASYLIHDACLERFDVALVLSQDTDLLEPIRIVKVDHAKPVGVVVLDGKEPGGLPNLLRSSATLLLHGCMRRNCRVRFCFQMARVSIVPLPGRWLGA